MAMIQGIDANALIKAFRTGRSDRAEDDKTRSAEERQKQIGGLMGQLFGGQAPASTGGVSGQFAPSNPAPAPQTFGEAFSPQAMAGIGEPASPPQAAPMQAPQRRPDPNVLAQLIVLDPDTGGKIASAFKTMDEGNLKRLEQRNNFMGAAARFVAQGKTPQERMQRFQQAAPQLIENGWSPQELDGIDNDLSDERLQFYQATAIDYDKMIDNELAEREFRAGKTVPVTAGGSVAAIRPTLDADGNVTGNAAEYIIGGGGSAVPPANLPSPKSKADFDALPAGAQFVAPDGTVRQKPGGQTGSAPSGGFPAGQ